MAEYDVRTPCELHEVTGCSICSGKDKLLAKEDREASWADVASYGAQSEMSAPERVAPGVVLAQYAGRCANCRCQFDAGDPIRFSKMAGGWVGTECC